MSRRAPQAPPARLALVFHAPTIARVEVVYQPAAGRFLRAALWAVICWGTLPLVIWIPPHYPWVLAAIAAGVYLPYRCWTGRYVVRSFTGFCPRCGRALELTPGTRIDLPHALTCFNCHFEPLLEVALKPPRGKHANVADARIEHRSPECTGRWSLQARRRPTAVVCHRCGARHCATPEARSAAAEENRRATLLAELTLEGRFLL